MLIAKGVDKMKDLKEVMRAKLFDMKVPLSPSTHTRKHFKEVLRTESSSTPPFPLPFSLACLL